MKIEQVAEICHEANRVYCQSIGDHSQPFWSAAPDWQKDSAIKGVKFHLENPEAPASASHESWMKQKIEEGWTYGEEKDPGAKKHHCLVPFEQLPVEQQAKDFLFSAIVHGLARFFDTATVA